MALRKKIKRSLLQGSIRSASVNEAPLRLLSAVDGVLIEVGWDHRIEVLPGHLVCVWIMRVVDESCHMTSRSQASAVVLLAVLG